MTTLPRYVLAKAEVDLLALLEDRRRRLVGDLASELQLPPFAIRSMIGALKQRELVERDLWHRYEITQEGLAELVRQRQPRPVR